MAGVYLGVWDLGRLSGFAESRSNGECSFPELTILAGTKMAGGSGASLAKGTAIRRIVESA
jgi:hypothetical protein